MSTENNTIGILGKVVNGRFIPYNRELHIDRFRQLEGEEVMIFTKPKKNVRKEEANAFLWVGVHTPTAIELNKTGQYDWHVSPEQVHEFCKEHLLPEPKKRKGLNGDYTPEKTTTTLSVQEFKIFTENAKNLVQSEFGIELKVYETNK